MLLLKTLNKLCKKITKRVWVWRRKKYQSHMQDENFLFKLKNKNFNFMKNDDFIEFIISENKLSHSHGFFSTKFVLYIILLHVRTTDEFIICILFNVHSISLFCILHILFIYVFLFLFLIFHFLFGILF